MNWYLLASRQVSLLTINHVLLGIISMKNYLHVKTIYLNHITVYINLSQPILLCVKYGYLLTQAPF